MLHCNKCFWYARRFFCATVDQANILLTRNNHMIRVQLKNNDIAKRFSKRL